MDLDPNSARVYLSLSSCTPFNVGIISTSPTKLVTGSADICKYQPISHIRAKKKDPKYETDERADAEREKEKKSK